MNRAGFTSRAAAIALCASAALLLASCSEEARDAIRSSVSDAVSSVSVSPPSLPSVSGAPEPTEEPTEEQTEEQTEATEEPTEEQTEATEEPDGSTGAGGSDRTDTSSTWIWILVAIAAIVLALILARMASRRREARAWRSRAVGVSSQGLALHDRVAAELAMGTHATMSSARWTDVETSIDRLATDVNQLAATAPAESHRSTIRDVSAALDGLRSGVLLQRSAQTGDQPSRELATQTLRERIGDFNGALRSLQIELGTQTGSATGPS
jgi:Protein of unknown function (DUF1180)